MYDLYTNGVFWEILMTVHPIAMAEGWQKREIAGNSHDCINSYSRGAYNKILICTALHHHLILNSFISTVQYLSTMSFTLDFFSISDFLQTSSSIWGDLHSCVHEGRQILEVWLPYTTAEQI